jgi:hypothetical protein
VSEPRRSLPLRSYPDLLHTAHALGRADCQLAADFEPLDGAGPSSTCCRGRGDVPFDGFAAPVLGGWLRPRREGKSQVSSSTLQTAEKARIRMVPDTASYPVAQTVTIVASSAPKASPTA